jgi:hypothetical protein
MSLGCLEEDGTIAGVMVDLLKIAESRDGDRFAAC